MFAREQDVTDRVLCLQRDGRGPGRAAAAVRARVLGLVVAAAGAPDSRRKPGSLPQQIENTATSCTLPGSFLLLSSAAQQRAEVDGVAVRMVGHTQELAARGLAVTLVPLR